MKKLPFALTFGLILILLIAGGHNALFSADWVTEYGLAGCIELRNPTTRVVLDPNIGGRVLVYEVHGRNILYFNPDHHGITDGYKIQRIDAGRFDFGPTRVLPNRDLYFKGQWKAEITGEHSARMVSQVDPALDVRVVREFELDPKTSRLICIQTLINVGDEVKYLFCWGRTFVHGGGITLTPVNPNSRYPEGHIGYLPCQGKTMMSFKHDEDPNVRIRDNILETLGITKYKKFVMDGREGWMGYLSPEDLMYIKKFKFFPDKKYGEMTAPTTSIWQWQDKIYEIEPYGPYEQVKPGESISFIENWYLFEHPFPADQKPDLQRIRRKVSQLR